MGIGHWALGIGHWALGIGHWALGKKNYLPHPPRFFTDATPDATTEGTSATRWLINRVSTPRFPLYPLNYS